MSKKPKPRTYHHGDLREALVKAGTAIVEDGGLSAFTLRECARRAGVSHAAPRNHFESVDDLIAEIAARGFEAFHAALDNAAAQSDGSPDQRLRAMGQAYVAFALGRPGVYGLMFRSGHPPKPSPHLAAAGGEAWTQLVEAVLAIIGQERDDLPVAAAQVWAVVHGIASLAIDKRLPDTVNVPELVALALANLPQSLRLGNAT